MGSPELIPYLQLRGICQCLRCGRKLKLLIFRRLLLILAGEVCRDWLADWGVCASPESPPTPGTVFLQVLQRLSTFRCSAKMARRFSLPTTALPLDRAFFTRLFPGGFPVDLANILAELLVIVLKINPGRSRRSLLDRVQDTKWMGHSVERGGE